MKQEHRFVAELYRYLAPFIDTAKPLFLSLDGEAAKKGVTEKHFQDASIPDLLFTVFGRTESMLVEAKIIEAGKITIGRNQLKAWCSIGPGRHKPSAWVAANVSLDTFYYWRHDQFLELLDACTSQTEYPKLRLPKSARDFRDIRLLALELLRA